ncbi:hypothetical protein [Lacticaseibacillus camelliae]|uniref:hypothetical protein n=1 Tax=Lacticaseibacillus camelliae TaxID=381742 RepID=UPI0006CFD30F
MAQIVSIFLQRFSGRNVLLGSIVIACIAGYIAQIGDFMALSRTIAFFPFFYAGVLTNPRDLAEKFKNKRLLLVGLVILTLAFAAIWVLLPHLGSLWLFLTNRMSFKYGTSVVPVWGGLIRLGYYLVVTVMMLAFFSLVPYGHTFYTLLGAKTMQIYAFHIVIVRLLEDLLNVDGLLKQVIPSSFCVIMIITILAIAICLTPPVSWFNRCLFPTVSDLKKFWRR